MTVDVYNLLDFFSSKEEQTSTGAEDKPSP
jgi:hypothetical protein